MKKEISKLAAIQDNETALDVMISVLDHLAEWPMKSVECFRNAALGDAIFGVNPALDIKEDITAKHMLSNIRQTIIEGRMIDFGMIPNAVLKETSTSCREPFESGELAHPFDTWLGVMPWEGGFTAYHVAKHEKYPGTIAVCELYGVTNPRGGHALILYDIVAVAMKPGETLTSAYPYIERLQKDYTQEAEQRRGANSLDPLVTMLKLLSDASVPVTYVQAPMRLNLRRIKHGKRPIPAHHVVHSRDYVSGIHHAATTRGAPQGGTHASPIAHWRRSHARHLASGKVVQVRASQVNWRDAEELHRLFYRTGEKV